VLVVNPSLPAKSVPELIADAKSNPGKITVASAGVGSAPYMYWQLFRSVTNVDMVHVPYHGGGPAITDLLGGQVQVYFSTFAAAIQYIRAGKLRALAVTGATRAPVLPDVPALAEFLPGYEASIYVGISAPRDTPTAIVGRLHQTINQALAESKVTQRIEDLGDAPLVTTTDGFTKLVADETGKWRTVIRKANIKAE
jgi:tripartite-type tricarboxylate transporter receptor subunit TctC